MKKYKKFWIIIIFFLALFIFITVIQSFTKSDFIKKFGNFFSNNTKLIIKKQIRKFIISNKSNFIFTKNFSKNFDNTNFVITSFKNNYIKSLGQ